MLSSDDSRFGGRLDDLDDQILAALRVDGRIGPGELATRLGVSRTTASKRLAALLHTTDVRVVGMVHPETVGVRSLAHVSIATDAPAIEVGRRLAARPEVPFVSLASGAYPLIAEVRAHDDTELSELLDVIRSLEGVESTETLVYTDLVRDVLGPTKVSVAWLDGVDRRLLSLLQLDGRMPYTSLAARSGVSVGTARARTLRMIEAGVVRIGAIAAPGREGRKVDVGLGVRMRGRAGAGVERIRQLSEVRFLATTIGRYDVVATLHADTLTDVVTALEEVRSLTSVTQLHSWVHLHTLKESYRYPIETGR
ncbi:Lrp/AsnC family transcriptional regulator [Mycolicibacterium cosmeticum]|uniref:Lrp/AsnC family transcriptional regulator n=1 Tax=Mycolicibacterium cosmeticum TaxID=258533 RepID=UPI003204CF98